MKLLQEEMGSGENKEISALPKDLPPLSWTLRFLNEH
jgi:hypothetical protein